MHRLHAKPVKPPSPYQEDQCRLFPGLLPYVEKEGKSQAAHVAKNMRLLLKKSFPEVVFSVKVQRFGGCARSIVVGWEFFREPPASPSKRAVQSLLSDFRWLSSPNENLTRSELRQRHEFQSVFGHVDYVNLSVVRPTLHALRRRREKNLSAALPQAPAPSSRPRI